MRLKLTDVYKDFNNFKLKRINLDINQGEYLVILGPSGAGKTVILELIAGLIKPDSGKIVGLNNKKIGLIYQDFMLFPHMNVFKNISYGLKIRKTLKEYIDPLVKKLSKQLGIEHLLDRDTKTLSGGEKQRVAIARAMAISPDVYLIDEPTASLDRNLRYKTQKLFMDLHRESRAIFVHVTHDFEEALALADKIALILDGEIVQFDQPDVLFNAPKSKQVADFLGYKNVFKGHICDNVVVINGIKVMVPVKNAEFAFIAVRNDDIILSKRKLDSSARNSYQGIVQDIINRNLLCEVVIDIGITLFVDITKKSLQELEIEKGKKIWLTFKVSSIKVFKH